MQTSLETEDESMKPFTTMTVVVLVIVAIVHLLRLILGWDVYINNVGIDNWVSVVGVIVAGGLAWGLWTEARK
ncbi:MAG: hypothetical protein V3U60_16875 [Gammaproteobacteria bacterium]